MDTGHRLGHVDHVVEAVAALDLVAQPRHLGAELALRQRLFHRQDELIDLERLGELRGVQRQTDGMSVGPMTTIYNLLSSPEVRAAAPLLSQAASKVGSTAIRNLGTIGGNLCHNEPGADLPPALLALDAVVELRSRKATRKVPLREFFRGYFETAITPDELLYAVEIPTLPGKASAVYLKHAISAEDLAIAGVAVVLIPEEQHSRKAREIRIGLGGVASVPLRASKAESAVRGAVLNDATIRAFPTKANTKSIY